MHKKIFIWSIITALIVPVGVMGDLALAEENTETLKKQIEALQKRVEELEAQSADRNPGDDPEHFPYGRRGNWDPFAEMDRMQDEMNRLFEGAFRNRGPSAGSGVFSNTLSYDYNVDLKEKDNGYEITFDMKGLDQDKVDIQINTSSITIKGEHASQNVQQGPGQNLQVQSFGSFMQTIPLPTDADTTGIKTEKKGDSLVITMPKKHS
ncbi:MAG: Hsp20/alpha crystallin family protein [Candidatus Omnitrophica bacterium]|nr:Hsp20/alpha crystallin family protein [Candidatus Omnitrophota bacterium]